MPIDVKALEGALAESLKAGMIPPDLPDEFKEEANKKVTEMAVAQIEGIAPFIEAFDELELRLDALENEVVPQLEEALQGIVGETAYSAGDFGSLTDKITGLEGDVNDLKASTSVSSGNAPGS